MLELLYFNYAENQAKLQLYNSFFLALGFASGKILLYLSFTNKGQAKVCGLYEKIKQKVLGKYLLRGLFISFISNKKQKQRSCSINYFFKDRNNIFMYNVYDTKRLKRIMQQKKF